MAVTREIVITYGGYVVGTTSGSLGPDGKVQLSKSFETGSVEFSFIVTGANAATLKDKYRGATETGLNYEVGGQGTRMIEFDPPPERAAVFVYLYYATFLGLYNDDDESPIPQRWDGVVNDLAAYRILKHLKI